MGWAIGHDSHWDRDIGYGVPAICDHPGCGVEIDRGIAYVCGEAPWGGVDGCGLFFCEEHHTPFCERCYVGTELSEPFIPTPDTEEWIQHKLTDKSWAEWRAANPKTVWAIWRALKPETAQSIATQLEGPLLTDMHGDADDGNM